MQLLDEKSHKHIKTDGCPAAHKSSPWYDRSDLGCKQRTHLAFSWHRYKVRLPFSLRVIRRCSVSICMRHNAYCCSWRHEIHYRSRDAAINCAIFGQPLLSSVSQKIVGREASSYLRRIFCQYSHKTVTNYVHCHRSYGVCDNLSWLTQTNTWRPNCTDASFSHHFVGASTTRCCPSVNRVGQFLRWRRCWSPQ